MVYNFCKGNQPSLNQIDKFGWNDKENKWSQENIQKMWIAPGKKKPTN